MRLLALPFESAILKKAAEIILKEHKDLSHIAVIFPTQRSKVYFQQFLAEISGREAMLLPRLYEVSEFLQEATISPYPGFLLNQWQRNLFLKEAIFQVRQDISKLFGNQLGPWEEDFLEFVTTGQRLLRFYDEILRERISFEALKKEALYTDYETHVEILANIFEHYAKLLKENRFIDPVLKETALLLDEDFLQTFKAIYFIGVITMTRTETTFFKGINTYAPLTVFFQANKKEGLISHQKVILNRWGKSEKEVHWLENNTTFNPPPSWTIRAFPQVTMQMGLILSAITQALNDGIKPHQIGIVLPDEEFKYLLLSYLSEHNLNLTMGLDIKHTLSYGFLERFFELFSSETEYGFYYQPFLGILSHPIIKTLFREEVKQWQEIVLKNNLLYVKKEILPKNRLFSFLNKIKRKLTQKTFGAFCKNLIQVLEEFHGYPELNALLGHYREIRGLNKILEALQELSTLEKLGVKIAKQPKFSHFFRFILKHLETLTYPLPARLTQAIQAMGILETRNMQFDVVIIPDMNEGLFPASSEKDLFLNTALRKRLGLPTYKDREGLYGYYFSRLTGGANRIYLSYVNDPKQGVRSRFIEKWVFEEIKKGRDLGKIEEEIKAYHHYLPFIMPQKDIQIPIKVSVRKDKNTLAYLETLKFSPSALLSYQCCPYQFYLKYVLQIPTPLEIKEWLTPQDIGQLLHITLKEVYTTWQPWEMSEEEFYHLLMRVLTEKLQQIPQFIHQPASRLGIEILKERFRFFVRQEYQDFQSGWRPQPQWLETEIEMKFKLGKRMVSLKGIPDRVDKKERFFRVIDYKTGYAPGPKQCEPGPEFKGIQLPFYLWLLNHKYGIPFQACEVLGIYDLKTEFKIKEPYKTFKHNPSIYMSEFKLWLEDTLARLFDTSKTWEKKPSPECDYCPYKSMCER